MNHIYIKEIEGIWFAVALDEDERIIATSYSLKERKDVVSSILKEIPIDSNFINKKPTNLVNDILRNMYLIYKGKLTEHKFELNMDRLPPFTKKALLLTLQIPYGSVTTYRDIAKSIGNEKAARAVGNAEARNPFAPIVPCHRVVNSDLKLSGHGEGLNNRYTILKREGIVFKGKRISEESVWHLT
ncbi:MAG: methylated-DNA--[protein]-cysteine S-methyltransferase [Candidatus Bathyarchaeota archaeon]|nr:MAG: methylated-DNA--[protein]-cysteine S-methyltransferase [Candidatus Bathyarchaeota archaeon]